MARRWLGNKSSASESDELAPYKLSNVRGLEEAAEREEKLGSGAYGYVIKVTVEGVECIAKKLHSAYVNQSEVSLDERQSITAKFRDECVILSKLRHPNIVQFLGVHYGRGGKADLALIMECVRCDMDNFLTKNHDVPLSLKLSILLDVSYGLVYLHECNNPPVIHRDLTARNILITDGCQAKIADLGVAKIVSLKEQLRKAHTKVPGQQFYMPPEALIDQAECTPKLDIFSFGHLTLFTVNQELPEVLTLYAVKQTSSMQEGGTIEQARRAEAIKVVGSGHSLYPIITECLYDRPDQRPTTRDLNRQLIQLSAQHPVSMTGVMPLMGEDMARISTEMRNLQRLAWEKDEAMKHMKEEGDLKVAEIADSLREMEGKRDKVEGELVAVLQDFERVQLENAELAKQLAEVGGVKGELEKVNQDLEKVRTENAELAKQLKEDDGVKDELDEVRQDLERVQAENAELAKMRGEIEKDLQKVRTENAELVKQLKEEAEEEEWEEQQLQELKLKHKRAEKEINHLRQKLESEKAKVQQLKEQLEQKMKLSEEEITTNMKSLLVDEEMCQLHPSTGTTISGPSLAEWNDLKAKVSHLEQQNKELQRIHLDNPVPSNVHQFCHQLSKLVNPEGESAKANPRPLPMDAAKHFLQYLEVGADFRPTGYIVAIFTAFNNMQSTLLDYTHIGEVAQFKGHNISMESGDDESPPHFSLNEKSPFSSLNEVKVEVTDGNMTDTDKLDLQQMLMESQKELENLRKEKENLMEHIEILEAQFYISDAKLTPESAATAKSGQGQPRSDADKLRQMKMNYLKVHNEMLQLLEKVKERDDQLKELRDGFGKTDNPPVNNQDPRQQLSDLLSPEDPRAEVDKLRATLDEKEGRIHNLTMQLRSLEGLGQDKICYEAQIAQLNELLAAANAEIEKLKVVQTRNQEEMKQESDTPKLAVKLTQASEVTQLREELEAAQAEIKKLRDESELVQVYASLNKELSSVRNHLQTAEGDKRDLEAEKDVWKQEVAAERENNRKLKTEVAQLRAALKFWEMKQPEAVKDPFQEESLSNERIFVEQMHQIEVADLQSKLTAKEAAIKSVAASRNTLESRLQRYKEERDGLARQNIELLAVKANLKGHFESVKHDAASLQGLAARLQNSLTVRTTELESCKREKELMIKEIKTLQDEIEAWKQEVAVIKEDFELERSDREKYASSRTDETGKWIVEKQKCEATIKHLTHEFKQREFQLAQKLKEMTSRYENALKCQKEADELCDHLREERDTFQMEMHRTHELYEEKRQEYRNILQQLEGEKEHLSAHLKGFEEKLQFIEVEKSSMQSRITELERELKKSENIHETTAALKREATAKLHEVTTKLYATEQQSQRYLAELRKERQRLEDHMASTSRISDDLSVITQERNHYKTQSESYKAKFQEENKRVHHLEQEMHKREEGRREEVDYIKAQCEDKMIEKDRQMVPMRRELEQLRTQAFNEGKFAETFRMIEDEKKELKQSVRTLESKNHALMDDITIARSLLITNNIPLPPRSQFQNDQRESNPEYFREGVPQRRGVMRQSSAYDSRHPQPYVAQRQFMPPQQHHQHKQGGHLQSSTVAYRQQQSYPSHFQPPPPRPYHQPMVRDPQEGYYRSPQQQPPTSTVEPQESIRGSDTCVQVAYMAQTIQDEQSEENRHKRTADVMPFDPNLVCPSCGKRHHIDEIQKFRLHVDKCKL